VAPGAEGLKAAAAPVIQKDLGHDAARRVPGAEEEDVLHLAFLSDALLASLRAADLHQALEVPAQDRAFLEGPDQRLELSLAIGIGLGRESIVDPASFSAALDDTRRPERAEVARNVGLRQAQGFLEMAHTELFVREERHDPESGLVP
jgi:hypothetical protein